jgi:cell division protein FtsW
VDKWLLAATLALTGTGLLMIYSITAATAAGRPTAHLESQGLKVLIGIVAFAIGYRIDYHRYSRVAPILYLVGVAALVLVFVPGLGHEVNGARRWIRLGRQTFQPADFARLAFIVYLAFLLAKPEARLRNFRTGLAPCLVALAVMVAPVLKQPNLSTAMAFVMIAGIMLVAGGIPLKHFLWVAAPGVLAAPFVVHPYQIGRLRNFLLFWKDGAGYLEGNYQLNQSIIAIGSGGFLGQGLGESRQKWSFLPDAHTDFIFAILGEELGFLGAVTVVVLLGIIMWRAYEAARRAPDRFGSLLAAGLGISVALYAGVNTAVATGMFPTTGLPLPLFSYGGTAVLVTLFSLGILANIATQGDAPRGRK